MGGGKNDLLRFLQIHSIIVISSECILRSKSNLNDQIQIFDLKMHYEDITMIRLGRSKKSSISAVCQTASLPPEENFCF